MKILLDIPVLLILSFKYLYVWVLLRLGYKDILRRETWLVSEKRTEARDNGYYMFNYLRSTSLKDDSYYSIVYGTQDHNKIANIGNVVKYNSLYHIALYLGSKYLLYCQIDSKPYENIHGIGRLDFLCRKKQVRVYLTHGICKDNVPNSYDYRLAGYNIFVCGAKPEYDYYKNLYNYPDRNIVLTGLCRFDGLKDISVDNIILIMPTFRSWLRTSDSTKRIASDKECMMMKNSDFFQRYSALLENTDLHEILKNKNSKILFYLHYTIQPYSHLFNDLNIGDNITICKRGEYDVQDLLKRSKILITDYSSVAFDFSYMKKPTAYYQFDYDKYRAEHYKEGFFNYDDHGVGPIIENENELVTWIEQTLEGGNGMKDLYLDRLRDFFIAYDDNNCKRVYESIIKYSQYDK